MVDIVRPVRINIGRFTILPEIRNIVPYLIAFGKPASHREVAPREFDVPGSMYEPLA